jgi:hypothetical protein
VLLEKENNLVVGNAMLLGYRTQVTSKRLKICIMLVNPSTGIMITKVLENLNHS